MRRAVGALLIGVALLTSACSGEDPDSVVAQAKAGDRKGYISGDGTIERLPADKRAQPVDLAGTTIDGGRWDSADVRGKVVVVNIWGSWCPPCVAEAADLQKAWERYESGGKVAFVGINFREASAETAEAFVRNRKITYPSLYDESGERFLDLRLKATPALPSTYVLDQQGRIAARVSGGVRCDRITAEVRRFAWVPSPGSLTMKG